MHPASDVHRRLASGTFPGTKGRAMVRFAATAVVLASVIACTGSSTDSSEPVADAVQTPDGEPEIPATEPFEVKPGYFTADWALWRAPTDEKKIPDPDGGEGTVKNYLQNVERGRSLERIAVEGDWSKVRIDDGTEGWIKTDRIVYDDGAKLATVTEDTRKFKRPDLLALEIESKVPAGALIITGKTDGKFVEIDYPTGKYDSDRTWVQADSLVTDDSEIEAARFVRRILQLRADKKTEAAAELEDLARGQFVGSKLLPLLEVTETPEEAAAEGGSATPGQ